MFLLTSCEWVGDEASDGRDTWHTRIVWAGTDYWAEYVKGIDQSGGWLLTRASKRILNTVDDGEWINMAQKSLWIRIWMSWLTKCRKMSSINLDVNGYLDNFKSIFRTWMRLFIYLLENFSYISWLLKKRATFFRNVGRELHSVGTSKTIHPVT
jgi:hypothetical protein